MLTKQQLISGRLWKLILVGHFPILCFPFLIGRRKGDFLARSAMCLAPNIQDKLRQRGLYITKETSACFRHNLQHEAGQPSPQAFHA